MSLDTLLSILFLLVFIVLPLLSRAFRQRPRTGGGSRGPTDRPGQGDAPPWLAEAQRRVREARDAVDEARERVQDTATRSEAEASTASSGRTLVPEDPFGQSERPRGGRSLVPEEPFRDATQPRPQRDLVPEDPFRQPRAPARGGGLVPEDPFERGLVGGSQAAGAGSGHAADTLGREGAPVPRVRAETASRIDEPGRSDDASAPAVVPRRRARRPGKGRMQLSGGVTAGLGTPAYGRRRAGGAGARLGPVDLMRFDRRAIVSGLIWHEILDEPAWKRRPRRASSRPRSR